jgi:SNF2 Helicase protein
MLSLHAGFRARRLLVWLESHPVFDAGRQALAQVLSDAGIASHGTTVETTAIWLPSVGRTPVPSSPLIGEIPGNRAIHVARSTVNTIALEPSTAVEFLCYCANKEMWGPGILVGPDLVWWTAAMRFAGALVARQQFLPGLTSENGGYHARWRAAYVGRDDDRRNALVAAMPPAARVFAPELPAARLLGEFLDSIVNSLVRSATPKPVRGEVLHDRWLAALSAGDGKLIGEEADLRQLERQLNDWRRPISVAANAPFRLCFRLEEPGIDAPESWRVRYLLQARNDPSLLVPADVIWHTNGAKSPVWKYPGFQPREHMLFSLGQASGICPRIEESLRGPAPDGYAIDATGAHDFLTAKAIGLEEAGFGVMLPAWWTRKGTKARLTAGATVKSPFQKGGGLSLDALLDFQWQVSIGGEKITLAELRALAALKAPLVKFRGQWVHVNAEDIQAALDF